MSYQYDILKHLSSEAEDLSYGERMQIADGKKMQIIALNNLYQPQICVPNLEKRNLYINPITFLRSQLMNMLSHAT